MTTEESKTEPTTTVQSTPTMRILRPAVTHSDWCHVCLSEGTMMTANECEDATHLEVGDIIVTGVVA